MNETDSTLPPLLARITHPSMVADLSLADKQILATELRQTIIRTVAANGGHLAPSLGVVELTLALLSVFDPEEDKLVWDVGHQSYAWKLLTGRSENFHTLRQLGGISGFPKIEESPFDHFGVETGGVPPLADCQGQYRPDFTPERAAAQKGAEP